MTSDTSELQTILHRVQRLERENRRLKRLGLLCLLIAGSGFLFAQVLRKPLSAAPRPAPATVSYDTLVVHSLELRDKAGKLRGVWTVTADGPFLYLCDTDGKIRTGLGAFADGSSLMLSDTAGKSRAEVVLDAEGPRLSLYDLAGKKRVGLRVTAAGPELNLHDANGFPRAGLSVTGDDPVLSFLAPAGKPYAALTEHDLRLTDARGFKAVVGATELETIATGESHTTSAAAITLFGKDGKVIWRAP